MKVREITGLKAGVNESGLPGWSLFILTLAFRPVDLDDFGAVAV